MKITQIITAASIVMLLISCGNQSETATATDNPEAVVAGHQTLSFKVWGNCEMCEETIEGSLKVNGVAKADWSTETDMITVSYDSSRISLDQIHNKIAAVGYDTDKNKGDDKAYRGLPECCQYERK
jgi:mercuric ion binding protein